MQSGLRIQSGYLDKGRAESKSYIRNEKIHEYIKLLDKDYKGDSGRVVIKDENCKKTLLSLEDLIGNFIGIRSALGNFEETKKEGEEVKIYSSLLNSIKLDKKENKDLDGYNLSGLEFTSLDSGIKSVLELYKRYVFDSKTDSSNILLKTESFKRALYSYLGKLDYQDIIRKYNIIIYDNDKFVFGFRFNPEKEEEKIRFDVGNEEIKSFLSIQNRFLGCYDPEKKKNFILDERKPRVVLLLGKPGTGKTELVKEANTELMKIAHKKGIGTGIVMLDNSFWNKYLGDSNKNFRMILETVSNPDTLNRLVMDDCESLIPRRESESSGDSGRRIVKELLSFIDNVEGRYFGNYDILMTSNYKELIDPALLSRTTAIKYVKGPKTVEQYYEAVFNRLLYGWEKWMAFDEDSKKRFSKKCMDLKYSGRDLYNITSGIKDQIRNPEAYSHEDFALKGKEFEKRIKGYFKHFEEDDIEIILNQKQN